MDGRTDGEDGTTDRQILRTFIKPAKCFWIYMTTESSSANCKTSVTKVLMSDQQKHSIHCLLKNDFSNKFWLLPCPVFVRKMDTTIFTFRPVTIVPASCQAESEESIWRLNHCNIGIAKWAKPQSRSERGGMG